MQRLARIKKIPEIENRENLTIQGDLWEKEKQRIKLESKNVDANEKMERNVSKGSDELRDVVKENKKKEEVKRSRKWRK